MISLTDQPKLLNLHFIQTFPPKMARLPYKPHKNVIQMIWKVRGFRITSQDFGSEYFIGKLKGCLEVIPYRELLDLVKRIDNKIQNTKYFSATFSAHTCIAVIKYLKRYMYD